MLSLNQKNRRLPGFRFEAFAPAREDILPRMDIALFVGFAAAGPVGVPVAVESAAQFKTVFGGDYPLVWDAEKGEMLYAYLAPSVRAFFRNGGRRCWILRVAETAAGKGHPRNRAGYNFFPLAGLGAVKFGKNKTIEIAPAFARASSRGSWSDDLRLGTAIISKALTAFNLRTVGASKVVTIEIGASESLAKGDLLKLSFREQEAVLFLAVDSFVENAEQGVASPPLPERLPAFGKRFVTIASERFVWLKKTIDEVLPPPPQKVRVRMWNGQAETNFSDDPQSFLFEHAANLTFHARKTKNPQPLAELQISNLPSAQIPAIGSLIFTKTGKEQIALQVLEAILGDETSKSVKILCRAVAYQKDIQSPGEISQAALLSFEIRVARGSENLTSSSRLAFNSGHERFWGNLPTDEDWYSLADGSEKINVPEWLRNETAADLPVAGNGDDGFYFPLFESFEPENYLGAVPRPGTKLQRDGLEVFDENLFLDPKLKNTGAGSLLNEGEFIRYLSARPRPLHGIHAALVPETASKIAVESSLSSSAAAFNNYSLDECTIVSVPDAVHRGWTQSEEKGEIIAPPVFGPPLRPAWWRFQDCRHRSIKAVSEPAPGNFLDCTIRVIKAPRNLRVKEETVAAGKFTIVWDSLPIESDAVFVLEESATPEFHFPETIFRGRAKNFIVAGRTAGVYFYRVRIEIGGDFSDWSNGLAVGIPAAENWTVNPREKYGSDVLLAVQRALLRMCAARGDLFAILDLPEHFEESEAFAHAGALRAQKGAAPAVAGVEPFSSDESRVLSYGALYHPWLLTRDEDFSAVRNVPPGGAIGGTYARRAASRGAWVAPANEILHGVLGLAKDVRRASYLDFQDNLINLVRHEPRGFLVFSSETLCGDADLRAINVRRLLSLLRRLAVRHGAEYVFEPNNERFRRQVERGFSGLLDIMFARGAFAGTTPANSYQVAISGAVNNFQSLDQGRFIVELRVAPSLPLKFVTVRLINAGGRSRIVEVF